MEEDQSKLWKNAKKHTEKRMLATFDIFENPQYATILKTMQSS